MRSLATPPPARWSFCAFFLLLSSYYLLRPLRETMGIAGGLDALHWVMTASCVASLLVVPLFGAAAARLTRRVLVPGCYGFFCAQLLIFAFLLWRFPGNVWVARAFVVWVSVFNLFVVSLFWSVMADLFREEEARRTFGVIAAGGSAGALAGPLCTEIIAAHGMLFALPLLSAVLLTGASCILARLMRGRPVFTESAARSPRVLEGVRLIARRPYLREISLFVFVSTLAPTLLYIFQGHIVSGAFAAPEDQTRFFARLDFAVNVLTLGLQLFAAGPLLTRFGPSCGLMMLPLVAGAGLLALAVVPVLPLFAVVQVLYRAAVYGIGVPSQEVLFTVVQPDEKYQAKNAMETVVARAGDAAAAWLSRGLQAVWIQLGVLAAAALPCLVLTAWIGRLISRRYAGLAERAK